MHAHQKQSRLVDNKLSLTNVRRTVCVIISNVTSSITIIQNSTRSSGGKFGLKSSRIFFSEFLKQLQLLVDRCITFQLNDSPHRYFTPSITHAYHFNKI